MATLNKNTKKAKQYINNYNKSNKTTLRDCFKSWSNEKENIFNEYIAKCYNEDGGSNFKIASYNHNVVVFGYIVEKDDKKYLYYITPSNDYIIEL